MATPFRIKRSALPGKRPEVSDLQTGELALNTYDVELYTLRDRFAQTGIATDVVRVGAGVSVTNILYVTTDGTDTNTGRKLGDAKRTIKGALQSATAGTVIKVSSGTYIEDNPLVVPKQVSIVGDSLREVTITPQNTGDLFHIGPGNYIAEMSFVGAANTGAIFAFNPNKPEYLSQSPYIQNCTNFIPNSIGMKIDGKHSIGPLKSMVLDSYTQYNQNGIGVSITNSAYAQLVSLFTICPNIAVYCDSGSACDLTNSNSSFGNYGLVADGVSTRQYTGIVTQSSLVNADSFTLNLSTPSIGVQTAYYDRDTGKLDITTISNHGFQVGMGVTISGLKFSCTPAPGITTYTYPSGNSGYIFSVNSISSPNTFSAYVGVSTLVHYYQSGGTVAINVVRPFDGQVVYFGNLYYTVNKIRITNPGSGYNSPPALTFSPPSTANDWGVSATAVAELVGGSVSNVEIVSSGRGYSSIPTVTFSAPDVGINTATAVVELLPTYYSIESSTLPTASGICTVTLNENLPYVVGVGTTVPFFKQSRVLASGHSFEYIGSGTDITTALPFSGGVPIQDNEVDMRNGGLVIYTSTDQTGNFRIGEGVSINQATGTISGRFYSKSLFSTVTPFILALGGSL